MKCVTLEELLQAPFFAFLACIVVSSPPPFFIMLPLIEGYHINYQKREHCFCKKEKENHKKPHCILLPLTYPSGCEVLVESNVLNRRTVFHSSPQVLGMDLPPRTL